MLTVCCLFVKGEYPYTPDYVRRLLAMVRQRCEQPFQFVCLTDQPSVMPRGVEAIEVACLPGLAFWTKLELFNPIRRWSGRILYLDLDTLLVAPLQSIVDYPAPFAITADPAVAHRKQRTVDSYGHAIVRRFNSSVMVWDGDATPTSLFERWSPAVVARLSGDQDWIGEQLPDAAAMPRAWFPRLSEVGGPPFDPDVKVVLSKYPKNHVAAQTMPWFEPLWGAA